MLRQYFVLTKPGIIRGNLLVAVAGYFLAATTFDIVTFAAVVCGTAFVIGSGCVLNNYLDRDLDKKMPRTKKRALVTGTISLQNALIFGTVLAILGFTILWLYTNPLTLLVGVIGWVSYVFIYDYIKRRSIYGTIVGGIPGATPPVAGYTAVTGSLDTAAILLFLIMFTWQMPHFYAIALFRSKEYLAAHVPVLPLVKGVRATVQQTFVFVVLFGVCSSLLYFFGYTSVWYFIIMLTVSLYWLYLAYQGFTAKNTDAWAKKIFRFSLFILTLLCVLMFVEFLLR